MTFAQSEALLDIASTGYFATAQRTANATLATLRALRDRGLIRFDPNSGKYQLTDQGNEQLR